MREIADNRVHTSGGEKYNISIAIYQDLNMMYQCLLCETPENEIIMEHRLETLLGFSKCLMLDVSY